MKNIVICDVDGTVSEIGDRVKYLKQEPKDWGSFYDDAFDDKPILETIILIRAISLYYEIIYCTGRRESIRSKTIDWMHKHLCPVTKILMRKDGDLRPDTIVKIELIREAGIDFNDIAFVLEDRACMVKKYRELGLLVYQVGEGEF
ncbi:MAG: hypothetical protein PHS33_09035 [Candidatus Omnitrophica bacterium]|nr:hypothetical protein [Candidatus Omnitrophota bacterium]